MSDSSWSKAVSDRMTAVGKDLTFISDTLPTATEAYPITLRVTADTLRRMREPLGRLKAILSLGPGWDSYGGHPVRPEAVLHAVSLLAKIFEHDVSAPEIVPTSTGGLQLEWHQAGADLEMDVSTDGTVQIFLQLPSEQTWEGPLSSNPSALSRFVAFVASDR